MKKLITKSQKKEIEKLALEHRDALIAFGADLYRQGLIKGAIIGSLGAAIGLVGTNIICGFRDLKSEHENQ